MMFFALTFAAISQSIIMKKYFNLPERSFSMCGTSLTLHIKQEIRAPVLTNSFKEYLCKGCCQMKTFISWLKGIL